ncbi:MAG: hypothetical protein EA411_03920 [Saprospirales bacterium]|nr:MAG: hypothetical protein EA411_03920 [Saprospirales bacterium]
MRLNLHLRFIALVIFTLPKIGLSGQDYHPLPDDDIRIYWENQEMFIVPPSLQLRGVEVVAAGNRLLTNSNYLERKPIGG